tara:strand:- start:225 stop:560 length:336 start_codon:yes stop_codon:yes gene_type:complete
MKKLLFIIAFFFIGQQAFSQIYIVVIDDEDAGSCIGGELTLSKTPPSGITTHVCIADQARFGISQLNQELNVISNLGYKLIETSYNNGTGLLSEGSYAYFNEGTTFIFAIP